MLSAITVIALTLSCLSEPSSAISPVGEDVEYRSDVSLAAELLLPEGEGPWPAAVILHGSGNSDRSNVWSRSVAQLFVESGVAVLLTDKRGCGKSGGEWKTSGFEDLAADALAGVDFLAKRTEIDSERIGLLGLSQGGWVAPLAAAGHPEVAFVINLSGTTLSFVEQINLEMTNTAEEAGLSPEEVKQVIDLNSAAGRFIVSGKWEPYDTLRRKVLKGGAQSIAKGFPATEDAEIWTFLKKVMAFDSIPYWSIMDQPVFICYGELDELDNVPVVESVRRIEYVFGIAKKKNYEVVVAPGVGHGLWDKDFEFEPGFIKSLKDWLEKYVLGAGDKTSYSLTS